MRVFRTILGMLLLTIGLPALLAGGGLWALMQHRDPGGAFSGELRQLAVPGYAVVVPDVDRLLRDDAPFARVGATRLRLSAATVHGPAFVGLAPARDVERYLTGVPHTRVTAVDIGTGALPLTTGRVPGRARPAGLPAQQNFWTMAGQGRVSWTPGELTGGPYSLVVMNPAARPLGQFGAAAEVWPSWLNSSTWGLLTLGTLLVMASIIVLAWPGRRREVVYVVEPSQVPDLMRAIGAPLPLTGPLSGGGRQQGGAHRPRTLADSRPSRPPALPQFSWPPNRTEEPTPELPVAGGSAPTATPVALAVAAPPAVEAAPPVSPAGAHTPAPGRPLNLLSDTPALAGLQPGPLPARRTDRRRAAAPSDLPEFHATAVGAWVAATAPERARQTEARAAARLAEAAARKSAAKTAPAQGGTKPPRPPIAAPRTSEPAAPESVAAEKNATKPPARPAISPAQAGKPTAEPAKHKPVSPAAKVAAQTDSPAADSPAEGRPASVASQAGKLAASETDVASPAGTSAARVSDPPTAVAPAASTVEEAPNDARDQAQRPAIPTPTDARPNPGPHGRPTPKPAVSRVAISTGPAATDWVATGLTRLGPPARPQPKPPATASTSAPATGPVQPASAPARQADHDASEPVGAPPSEGHQRPAKGKTGSASERGGASRSEARRDVAGPGRSSMHAIESARPPAGNPLTNRTTAAPSAGVPAASPRSGQSDRASMHTVELDGPAPAVPGQSNRTPGPGRKPAGRTGQPDQPLSRAQSRTSGKATPLAPGRLGATARKAPAAWIKAAENVAARVAQTADESDTTKPPTASSDSAAAAAPTPESLRAARAGAPRPKPPGPGVPPRVTHQPATTEPKGTAAAKQTGTAAPKNSTAVEQAETAGLKDGAAVEQAGTAGLKDGAAVEQAGTAGLKDGAAVERAGTAGLKDGAAAQQDTEPKDRPTGKLPTGRTLSYREEAAELLAGSNGRRRRRTVAGQPADRTGPSNGPTDN